MTLPTQRQLDELSSLIVHEGKRTRGKWYSFDSMMNTLEKHSGKAVGPAIQSAATHGAAAVGVTTGTMFVPFGVALSPWIAAAAVVKQSGDIFDLHDMLEAFRKKSIGHYACGCGKCEKHVRYVLDKKERNVGRVAIGVATIGVSAIFTTLNSIRKSFQKGRPKEMTSRALVDSARGGCTLAMATIFLLSGSWEFIRGSDTKTMNKAIAIMTSEDGWEKLKASW